MEHIIVSNAASTQILSMLELITCNQIDC